MASGCLRYNRCSTKPPEGDDYDSPDTLAAAPGKLNPAVEILPARPLNEDFYPSHPLHDLCLFRLGVYLGELWHLSELADWLAAHQRHAFLLTAPPLRLPGAVGSPATPIATV